MREREDVASAIEAALKLDFDMDADTASDVAFHMTDWLRDQALWVRFCDDPASLSRMETVRLLLSYLAHVPNHLNAAYRLMYDEPVRDVFGIGAVPGSAELPPVSEVE